MLLYTILCLLMLILAGFFYSQSLNWGWSKAERRLLHLATGLLILAALVMAYKGS